MREDWTKAKQGVIPWEEVRSTTNINEIKRMNEEWVRQTFEPNKALEQTCELKITITQQETY